jgi:hypothetical protein
VIVSNLLTAFKQRLGEGKSSGPSKKDERITGRHSWDCGCMAQQVLDNVQWNMIRPRPKHHGAKWL